MGFLYGFIGAVLGAVVGIVTAFFTVAALSDGNDLVDGFGLMGLAPVGLVVGAVVGIVLALKLCRYVRGNWGIKSARRKTTVVLVGSILAVPALVAAMVWGVWQAGQPPSDQQLLVNSKTHHATFNQLAQMTQADKHLTRVDYSWTEPSDPESIGVSAERIGKYRHLLDSVKLHRGFEAYHPHEVNFLYYATGSAISSDTDKGYAYLTAPPKETLPSLDGCQPDEKNGVEAYRHIEGCWYLYYDYLPG